MYSNKVGCPGKIEEKKRRNYDKQPEKHIREDFPVCTKCKCKYKQDRWYKNIPQSSNSTQSFKYHPGWLKSICNKFRYKPDIDEKKQQKE